MKEIFTKEFRIFFGGDVLEQLAENLIENAHSKVFVLMDENTEKYCWPIVKPYLVDTFPIRIQSGEASKNIGTVQQVWTALQDNFADRHALLINLGGGVLSDLGGFAAATYKRGINFINIPTTLLSMVDAAVGGKQGIDLDGHKNAVGVFRHPQEIFVYPAFLKTLPEVEIRNGFAELTKHGLIEDKSFWQELTQTDEKNPESLDKLIFKSLKIKASIVKKDPLEADLRKSLNFGHTIGHAFETYSLVHDDKPLKHGEAVVIGMIAEAWLSKNKGWISDKELESIRSYFTQRFPKYAHRPDNQILLSYMLNDKKNRNGLINFSLLKKVGKSKIDVNCTEAEIKEAIAFYYS